MPGAGAEGDAGDPAFAEHADPSRWPQQHARLAELFASRRREAWCTLIEGSDACFAPVLEPDEAAGHPHMQARLVFVRPDGVLQAAPAPRFSRTPATAGRVPARGEPAQVVSHDWTRASETSGSLTVTQGE